MMPFEGGVLDQPYMTMQILRIVQQEFKAFLQERRNEMFKKGKNRSL